MGPQHISCRTAEHDYMRCNFANAVNLAISHIIAHNRIQSRSFALISINSPVLCFFEPVSVIETIKNTGAQMKNEVENTAKKRDGRSEFLSVRKELEEKIALGHTLITIYLNHSDSFSFGYSQFTRYVTRYYPQSKGNLKSSHGRC